MACTDSLKVETECVEYVSAELVNEDDSNNAVQLESEDGEYSVAYANDTPTVFVQQGQYVIPVSGHTVVLQDDHGDFEHYMINDNAEEPQDAEQMGEEMGQPIIYYTGEFADQSQIFEERDETFISSSTANQSRIEVNATETLIPIPKQIKLEQNYIDTDNGMQDCAIIEDNLAQLQEVVGEKVIVASSGLGQLQPQYQYAILKNGKLHLQTLDVVDAAVSNQFSIAEDDDQQHQQLQEQLAAFQQSINMDDTAVTAPMIDLDKITGRNLITGQTVTLDSYFDKLQRRLATVDVNNQCLMYNSKKKHKSDLLQGQGSTHKSSAFINKKVVVGKTSSGKRIVGKILRIHTTKSGSADKEEGGAEKGLKLKNMDRLVTRTAPPPPVELSITSAVEKACDKDVDSSNAAQLEDGKLSGKKSWAAAEKQQRSFQPHIIIKKHVVTRENFDYSIGKTLSGLMELETVQRRLQNRNLVVKLVEKAYDHGIDSFNKTVSYVYGHMALVNVEEEKPDNQGWVFVLHNENDNLPTGGGSEDEDMSVTDTSLDAGDNDEMPLLEKTRKHIADDDAKTIWSDDDEKVDDEIKDVSLEVEDMCTEYNETVSLTIVITIDKSGKKSTRVNLSPQQSDNRCHICNKEFKTGLQLRKHISNVHFCEKSAKCDLCGKNFANQAVLQRHQKIHMGERWYRCPKCSKSFNTAGSLKRHLTVHDPSLRPLECSVCVQRFTDESSLRKHLLIHTGIRAYACEVCNRAFVNQGDLNFHRRIHDPVKQFSCEVCGREFSRHSNLMRHAEIHCGAGALHRCDICGCSYSFISSLTRHIVQKHIGQQQQE